MGTTFALYTSTDLKAWTLNTSDVIPNKPGGTGANLYTPVLAYNERHAYYVMMFQCSGGCSDGQVCDTHHDLSRAPYCYGLHGVEYIGLVSLAVQGFNPSGSHLDLICAPYVLYGLEYIDLASRSPNLERPVPHTLLGCCPYVLYGVKYIDLVSPAGVAAAGVNGSVPGRPVNPTFQPCPPPIVKLLDLGRAPYVLYGVKCIDLVSLLA